MTTPSPAAIREMLASGAWKIVPVEPTEEMIKAAGQHVWFYDSNIFDKSEDQQAEAKLAYRVMLAASPAAPDIAAEVLRLEAENARLRKALEPFAEEYASHERNGRLKDGVDYIVRSLAGGAGILGHAGVQLRDMEQARAALSPQEGRV